MIREPWFWREETLAAHMLSASLSPFGALYTIAQRLKHRFTTPIKTGIPVICIGNATLGGVGKTPFALMLYQLLADANLKPSFLSRGYGGTLEGPTHVNLNAHNAADVGDEALLLAAQGPCIIAANRPAGAQKAADKGADIILMDDGFQNPSLKKTFSFLLTDNNDPFGNGRVFPAGPMREPFKDALARAQALVVITKDQHEPINTALSQHVPTRPLFKAWLEADTLNLPKRAVAFCGIGRPQRFFDSLTRAGVQIAESIAFADHHPFSAADIARLKAVAKAANAPLITTQKDKMRLSVDDRQTILTLPVRMRLHKPSALITSLDQAIADFSLHQYH